MKLFSPSFRQSKADTTPPSNINDLPRAGSQIGRAVALTAAILLIVAAGSQNVAHGYELGLNHSLFRALVLAGASAGATLLGPFCFLAAVRSVAERRFGTAFVAVALGIGCLVYAATCSLGFVSSGRDLGAARADATTEARTLAKKNFDAADAEIAKLGTGKRATERRKELEARKDAAAATLGSREARKADSQAAAVAFVLSAAGWRVDVADVGQWLNVGMVGFLEAAAAFSLMVASGLQGRPPVRVLDTPAATLSAPGEATGAPTSTALDKMSKEWNPPIRRKIKEAAERAVLDTVKANNGRLSDTSVRKLGKMVGIKKSTVHSVIVALIASGVLIRAGGDLLLSS